MPPTLESTWDSSVVGIWTKRTPRRSDGRAEAGEIADDAAAERDDDVAPLDAGRDQRVRHAREFRVGFCGFARRTDDRRRGEAGATEARVSPVEIERRDVRVGHDRASRAGRDGGDFRPGVVDQPGADRIL